LGRPTGKEGALNLSKAHETVGNYLMWPSSVLSMLFAAQILGRFLLFQLIFREVSAVTLFLSPHTLFEKHNAKITISFCADLYLILGKVLFVQINNFHAVFMFA
jgi:hypothetical protein